MKTSALQSPLLNASVPSEDEMEMNDPEMIEERLGNMVDIILDGGILISEPSTVYDLTSEEPVLIRAGKGEVSLVY